MHRCEVRMRDSPDTPSTHLVACGDTASKKVGKVWMCDYHYQRFGVPVLGEEYFALCSAAVDADESNEKD